MADTVHVTKNSGEADATVSAVTITDLIILIGSSLPTSDPHVAGAFWTSAGTLKVSAG